MKLSLIGAGPGDEELITLKAIRLLSEGDVILYDALSNEGLLKYANENAELIYVGKRSGKHSVSQQEINRIIKENALLGKHVVRLKGGDPVVFGRAFEEIDMAKAHGIECELVPGISSAIGVPTLCEIPITKRGYSDSFWVLTGHTHDDQLPQDLHLAAQSNATIVILMGMSKLSEICNIFKLHAKEEIPMAIIENGTRENERIVMGKLCEIEEKVHQNKIKNPAVIVIGEVVKLAPAYVSEYVRVNYLEYGG